jgi:hypothetical protein
MALPQDCSDCLDDVRSALIGVQIYLPQDCSIGLKEVRRLYNASWIGRARQRKTQLVLRAKRKRVPKTKRTQTCLHKKMRGDQKCAISRVDSTTQAGAAGPGSARRNWCYGRGERESRKPKGRRPVFTRK